MKQRQISEQIDLKYGQTYDKRARYASRLKPSKDYSDPILSENLEN